MYTRFRDPMPTARLASTGGAQRMAQGDGAALRLRSLALSRLLAVPLDLALPV